MGEVKHPISWEKCSLGDVARVRNGFAFKSAEFTDTGVPVIRISDINGNLVSAECSVKIPEEEKFNSFKVKNGDILIAMSGATTGKFGIYHADTIAYQNQRVGNIRPLSAEIDKSFLFYCLFNLKRKIEKEAYGGAQPNISSSKIEQLIFLLPPLNEQKRIVAKIEELFSELDKGIESLQIAREQLKVYRQAVLKHAFEGKLTEQWRKDNADKLESPEQLLARIQQERDARYQQQLEDWKTAVKEWENNGKEGKKPGKPREQKIPVLPSSEEESLPKLPEGWMWVHPEHLMSSTPYSIGIGPFGSNLKVVDYRESGVPLIFVRNITRNNFTNELKFVDFEKSEELYAHQVKPLDLVITKMGDPPGDCEIYPANLPTAVLTADCLKFRVSDEFVDRYFYKSCINSNLVKRQLGLITRGVAQKKISVDRFKTIALPLPSKLEQEVIASLIEEIFVSINKTEEELSTQLTKAETLRQSILKKAFSGQLVPQDPNDEPASELLARIQAEKVALSAKAKKTPAKRGRKAKEVSE